MPIVIDGKKIAVGILKKLKAGPKPKKFLAAVLVGDNPASVSFLKQKEKAAKEVGVEFRLFKFETGISASELSQKVKEIAGSQTCGGLIVQLPLPASIETRMILDAVPAEKDPEILAPAALTVAAILENVGWKLEDLNVAVVGQGELVGQPIAKWLSGKVKSFEILRRGSDFSVLKDVNLAILGTGQAGLIKPETLKEGAGVIDFGYGKNQLGKFSGDLDISGPELPRLKFYTPTPGGTGPILVAKLLENFFNLSTFV